MTNAQLIFNASVQLMENGVIKGTGRVFEYEDENGEKKTLAEFSENSYTWGEVADMQDIFLRLARRYGLVREFRENGII